MKRFKDPIYGYIEIPKDIVKKIIDTPEFQRLRYIKQTSYLPVYSAALHNRFVHSLGVYYLGVKAYDSIKNNSKEILEKYSVNDKIEETIKLACLLHDVGHSPFSHSGENFFIDESKSLYDKLVDIVNNSQFSSDVDYYNNKPAAPHEIMSVVVALKQFDSFFDDSDSDNEIKSFFARCITGYKYRDADKNVMHSILNALISLLNSSTIDVDRLDYLIRDAYVMGFNSISIDYNRLIDAITLVETKSSSEGATIQLAYNKSALSVIENVIYAHDSEKKWIQNHPVIQYEVFLVQRIITDVKIDYKKRTGIDLFSLESLLPSTGAPRNEFYEDAENKLKEAIKKANEIKEHDFSNTLNDIKELVDHLSLPIKISSLCDDDIIYLAKHLGVPLSDELLDRNSRRHPVWKSESEYRICVDCYVGNDIHPCLQEKIKILSRFQNEESPSHCINNDAINYCNNCLNDVMKSELSELDKEIMVNRYELLLKWLNGFKKIAENQSLKTFDFVIVPTSKFRTSFNKNDLSETPIYFHKENKLYKLKELINLFSTKNDDRQEFFYVFYKRGKDCVNAFDFGKDLAKLALE